MSLKNLEKISEEIHLSRGTDLSVITPPGPREPGVGATDEDNFDDPESTGDTVKCDSSGNKMRNLVNLPIADIMNQMEMDNSMDATSLDTNSIFSEDKDDEDYVTSTTDDMNMNVNGNVNMNMNIHLKRNFYHDSNSMTTNSRNEVIGAINAADPHELNLEELRQKVKLLAVRPVEGSDGQTKDCWETELNETVNKLDRLMMLQEKNNAARDKCPSSMSNSTTPQRSMINANNNECTGTTIATQTPTPMPMPMPTPAPTTTLLSLSLAPVPAPSPSITANMDLMAGTKHQILTPTHCNDNTTRCTIDMSILTNSQSQSTSATKAFLNNSLQAVQQKMEDFLPNGSQVSSSVMKELPLLSRISNEISANTANTVKVLKRRLSLN